MHVSFRPMGMKGRGFRYTVVAEADNPRQDKSPLTRGSYDGKLALVKKYIDRGDDVHGNDNQRWFGEGINSGAPYYTPLGEASRNGHAKLVRVLLDAGAFVNAKQYTDKSAFQEAESGYPEVLEVLLDAGADPSPDLEWGNALATACAGWATDKRSDYLGTIRCLVQREASALLRPTQEDEVLASFDDLPGLVRSKQTSDRTRAKSLLAHLEALSDVWPGARSKIDRTLAKCSKAGSTQKKAAKKSEKGLQRYLSAEALSAPGWEAAIATLIGTEIHEARMPALQELCRVVMTNPAAIAHNAWPSLVKKLMDLTIDYRSYTEEIFGEAIDPDNDETCTMDGVNDDHMYSVDLVIDLLATEAAFSSKQWSMLFHYACQQKQAKLGYWSFGEDEAEALLAKRDFQKRPDRKKLEAVAKRAWPYTSFK